MPKVTLNKDAFKALASDTRLEIIRSLDGKKMNLTELSKETNLNKATLHEHLTKLSEAGLIKRIQRKGHKWVYYKLSWKGESLLHPENTKIVVVFVMAFTILAAGFIQMYFFVTSSLIPSEVNEFGIKSVPLSESMDSLPRSSAETGFFTSDLLLYTAIICFLIFIVLIIFSIHKLWRNKQPSL